VSHTEVVGVVAYKRNAKSTNDGRTTQLPEFEYDLLVCDSLHSLYALTLYWAIWHQLLSSLGDRSIDSLRQKSGVV